MSELLVVLVMGLPICAAVTHVLGIFTHPTLTRRDQWEVTRNLFVPLELAAFVLLAAMRFV